MNILLTPIRLIYFSWALFWFLLFMFIVFPCVAIASLFGKIRGGNIIYQICRVWADLWMFLVGIYHRNIFEVPHDASRPYIFVANHISYMDIPFILKAVRHQHLRVLGKASMKKIPVFGFIYSKAAVMVDRDNASDRARSVRDSKSVVRKNISIFIYPEGTFNTTHRPLKSFYDGAFRIAIEMQAPIKPILFLDGYARLPYESIIRLNPGRSRAIFLEEVSVEGFTVKDVRLLKEKVYRIMEQKLIEYKASWIRDNPATGPHAG